MLKKLETWLASKVHGGDPESTRDFPVNAPAADAIIQQNTKSSQEPPEIDLVKEINKPDQIDDMLGGEVTSNLLGFLAGALLKILQKINEPDFDNS